MAFLVWTLLVWSGRVRNAFADATLDGSGRAGPLLLAAAFVVPALVLAGLTVGEWRRGSGPGSWSSRLLVALVAWTVVVWVVRGADIAFAGDHDPAFVAVHLVLAVVSIGLGVLAVRGDRCSSRSSP